MSLARESRTPDRGMGRCPQRARTRAVRASLDRLGFLGDNGFVNSRRSSAAKLKRRWSRTIRAELRDIGVLFRESRVSLFLFFAVLLGGAFLFYHVYTDPDSGPLDFGEALYGAFSLIFFGGYLGFPEQWYLRVLYYLIPIVGLAALVDGVLRFGVALVSKRDRGQKWQVAMASTYDNHVIVCGIGRVGYRVILELIRHEQDVVAIESNPEGRFVEKAKGLGIPVIIADARRSANLVQAGVKVADAIIPCTDDELANLDIALDARELNPAIKVVMRLFDADLARRVEKGFGIHTAYSTSALAAPIFAAASMRFDVKHSCYMGDTLLNLSELCVRPDSELVGWTLARLEADLGLRVVCYHVGACPDLNPDPHLELKVGDKVMVMATLDSLERLNDLNNPAERSKKRPRPGKRRVDERSPDRESSKRWDDGA
jgi:voltage-gated potassium channel